MDKEQSSLELISNAYFDHKIEEVWAMFSGGHDSLVNTHVTSKHPAFRGVLHIDTGTGIKETQDYVIETCKKFNWELKIYRASSSLFRNGFKAWFSRSIYAPTNV